MNTALAPVFDGHSAVFAGADVCDEAGLALPDNAARPAFEDDIWDFTHVIGLPTQLSPSLRRFDFTLITDTRWRLVAKELILAMLAPRHQTVAPLPRAFRNPLHVTSCRSRLDELVRFFNWLGEQATSSLQQITTRDCEAYLAHRRYVLDEDGAVIGENSHATRRSAAPAVVDLVSMDLLRWFRFIWVLGVDWDRADRSDARDFARWMQLADKPVRTHWRRRDEGGTVPRATKRRVPSTPNLVTGKSAPGPKYAASTRAHCETVVRSFYDFHIDQGTGPVINPFPLAPTPPRNPRRAPGSMAGGDPRTRRLGTLSPGEGAGTPAGRGAYGAAHGSRRRPAARRVRGRAGAADPGPGRGARATAAARAGARYRPSGSAGGVHPAGTAAVEANTTAPPPPRHRGQAGAQGEGVQPLSERRSRWI